MRSFSVIILNVLFILSINTAWGQSLNRLQASLPNYYNALNSENEGAIISAIENLVKLKIFAPDLDYSEVSEKLNELTEESENNEIKYKAFIAHLFLQNPERFYWISGQDKEKKSELFDAMFAQIKKRVNK